ncbi:MAG: hypothetical protein IJZ68_08190 [Bacteroidaceae bacterium]|nr:hypothetical protein [Bacteroidaceae bacterium]
MVHVNIHSKEALSQKEMSLLAHVMFIMCTNPEFAEDKQPIMSDGLTLTRHALDDEGNETGTEVETISREEFVKAVNKGMNSVIQLTVQTADGDKTISRPFFPVTLIDIPMAKKASITLDYVPDFLPKFNDGKLGFMFRGELMEFAQQDIDEEN